jgi:chromosome segregation ATPase
MRSTDIDKILTSVKRSLEAEEKLKNEVLEVKEELSRSTEDFAALQERCDEAENRRDELEEENDDLRQQRDMDQNEIQQLRDVVECGGYFEQRLFESKVERDNEELRKNNEDHKQDIGHFKQQIAFLQEALNYRFRQVMEYQRIFGPIDL